MHCIQMDQSHNKLIGVILASITALAPMIAFGDFKGSDSLAFDSGNWTGINYLGDGVMLFRNSRLEFQVSSPQDTNSALAVWRPNTGSYQKSWFVQVDVHSDKPSIPDNSYFDMGITVESTSLPSGICSQIMSRVRTGGVDGAGFVLREGSQNIDSLGSPAKSATMRLHFDAAGKNLVGSFNDGSGWKYSTPLNILSWGMRGTDGFYASLYAQNGGASNLGLATGSGSAYFKNFKAGPAVPDITVHQPAGSGLKDGMSKTAFGSVSIKWKGRSKVYLIANEGTAPLEDLKIRVDGVNARDFVVTQPTSTLLMPGGRTLFKVTFRPKVKGNRKAVLHVKSNDIDEASFDVNLGGKGLK